MATDDAPRKAAPEGAGSAGSALDSRRWTGPAAVAEPPPYDVPAARAVFAEAGGPEALSPQRAASAVSWAGLVLLPLVVLLGDDARARFLGLGDVAGRVHGWAAGRLGGVVGPEDAAWALELAGNAKLFAFGLAGLGASAAAVLAWRRRAALARGFAAVEARWPGALFHTGHRSLYALVFVIGAVCATESAGLMGLLAAPALWLAARLAAAAAVGTVERWVAGLGLNGREPDDWAGVFVVLGMGALLLVVLAAMSWLA